MKSTLTFLSILLSVFASTSAQTFRDDVSLSDPFVFADSITSHYYMTGTGGDLFRSADLEQWEKLPWAINSSGIDWVGANYTTPSPGQIWAPELYHRNGAYYEVVTFTNPNAKTEGTNHSRRSIHILKSNSPAGPFAKIPGGDALYLPATKMAIDGTVWEEDGKLYLVYCYEWVQAGTGCIEYIELKPDMTGCSGTSHLICKASDGKSWNNSNITDGPFLFRTKTGRLGMIWTSWRDGIYVQGVAYSDNGKISGKWTQSKTPIAPDNHGHGMLFRSFNGDLLMSIHSNRNIDLSNQVFERHPALFLMDDSGDELRALMEYKPQYSLNKPAEVVVTNPTFDYSTNGWTITSNAVNKGIASNQIAPISGNYLESWDKNSFTGGAWQSLKVPNGTYRLSASAFRCVLADGFSEDSTAVRLYADDQQCYITSNKPQNYSLVINVTDEQLTFGICQDHKNYQWMGIDNVKIVYYGAEQLSADDVERMTQGDDAVYLQNKQTGRFLNCGQSWGTQAVLSKQAMDFYLLDLPNGKYAIDSKVKNGYANHYLGAGGYVDAEFVPFTIEWLTDNECTLSANGKYWGAGSSQSVRTNYASVSDATTWLLHRRSNLLASFAKACETKPVDATFLIKSPNFGRNDTRTPLNWLGTYTLGGQPENQCVQASVKEYDIYQVIKNVPNGFYQLNVQGFYRDGSASVASSRYKENKEVLQATVYANDETLPLMSIFEHANDALLPVNGVISTGSGTIPSTLEAASAAFSAGLYEQSIFFMVTNGELRIGVNKTMNNMPTNNWTVIDNFRLYYYGAERPTSINSVTDNKKMGNDAVYDLSGRKLGSSSADISTLPKGIYITGGRKIGVR